MDQRGDRAVEIVTQAGIPPDYYASILGLTPSRNRFTVELITIVQVLTAHVTMIAKHHLACRRPDRLGATVMPMLATPGHGTFPSAHAAEAFAVATVLRGLVTTAEGRAFYPDPDRLAALLAKLAERIAVNRTVAGLHFPVDSWAGAALGETIGGLLLSLCGAQPIAAPGGAAAPAAYRTVDVAIPENGAGQNIAPEANDFLLRDFLIDAEAARHGVTRSAAARSEAPSELMQWLWGKALGEMALA
jgi:hypothetical protein